MRRILVRGAQAIEVLRWPGPDAPDVFMEFRDPFASLDFLRPFLDDPVSLMTLREALAEESGYTDITGLDDQEVLEELAWRLVWGQVKIAPSVISRPAVQLGIAAQAVAEEEEEPVAPAAVEQRTAWIEIELIDEDGSPVAGEAYRIALPDGSIREGQLDANGQARLEGIDPGTCKVSFPNLDANEWQRVS